MNAALSSATAIWRAPLTLPISFGVGLGLFTIVALSSEKAPLILAAAILPFVAVITGRIEELLLTIIILDIPFGLDIHLGFREEAARMGALGGFNVSASTICIALLYAHWFFRAACNHGSSAAVRIREAWPLVLYIGALALSAAVAVDRFLAGSQIWLYVQMLLLYIYVVRTTVTRKRILFIVGIVVAGLLIEGLLTGYVWLTGQHITLGPLSTEVDRGYPSSRLGGTLGSPNDAGGYFAMAILLSISLFLIRIRLAYKFLAGSAVVFGGAALIFTGSRGGWSSFASAFLLLMLVAWRRGWLSPRLLFAVLTLTTLLGLVSYDVITTRFLADDKGAAYSRIPLMTLALHIIAANPLIGVGANNFAASMNEYITPELRAEWMYSVHNKYLLIWSETGIIGLMAFLFFIVLTLRSGWAGVRSRDVLLAPLSLGLTAAVFAHLGHMTVDVLNGRPLVQMLIVLAALIQATHALTQVFKDGCKTAPRAFVHNGGSELTQYVR